MITEVKECSTLGLTNSAVLLVSYSERLQLVIVVELFLFLKGLFSKTVILNLLE